MAGFVVAMMNMLMLQEQQRKNRERLDREQEDRESEEEEQRKRKRKRAQNAAPLSPEPTVPGEPMTIEYRRGLMGRYYGQLVKKEK